MTIEEFNAIQAEMTNDRLIELAEKAISDLCKHGDRKFTMSVPPKPTDTDMIFCELIKRYKILSNQSLHGHGQNQTT